MVTGAQLRAAGLTPGHVARLVADKVLLRLRRDLLVDAAAWHSRPPWERHTLRARGTLRSLDPDGSKGLALSHHSALAVLGLALFAVDNNAHLVRTKPGRGHRSRGVQIHARVDAEHVTEVDGLRVVRAATAVAQVAALSGIPAGLVAADSALREKMCTTDDLRTLVDWSGVRRGRPAVRAVAELADGRRESAGESRAAWSMHLLSIRAVPQVTITTQQNEFVARVDFLLRDHRVIVEFDGMGKYGEASALRGEKRREDALRSLGYVVVRLTWEDLDDLTAVRTKIEAAIRIAGPRR